MSRDLYALAEEFIGVFLDHNEDFLEEARGKTLGEMYEYGNDCVDQDIDMFLEVNDYVLDEDETDELWNYIYRYRFY